MRIVHGRGGIVGCACIWLDAARLESLVYIGADVVGTIWNRWSKLEVSTFLDLLGSGCVVKENHCRIITRDAYNVLMEMRVVVGCA